MTVKSKIRKARQKPKPKVLAVSGNKISVSSAQQGSGRGRLRAVAKALSQIIAERRRQGVALFRKFVEAQEGARHG